jgi:hypothetical protein
VNDADARFVDQAIRREGLFRVLTAVGVVVGLGLLGWAVSKGVLGQPWGATSAIAIMVLLNARGNLRQAKYARILRQQREA